MRRSCAFWIVTTSDRTGTRLPKHHKPFVLMVGPTELESVTSTVSRWRSSLSMLIFLQIVPIFACGKCVSHRLSQRYRNVARFQLLSQNRLAGEPGDTGSQVPYGRAPL